MRQYVEKNMFISIIGLKGLWSIETYLLQYFIFAHSTLGGIKLVGSLLFKNQSQVCLKI